MDTLFRKYRPLDFDTVVGQEAIVKTLRNQIINKSIAHAYLFSGIRGTGKTTIARIFARAINCPNEEKGNPCNECSSCKSTIEDTNLNIVEIDAASNRSIEGVRRVIEQIEYPPINDDKYKVFIIDEAHALTGDAAQAFLKSLEEPPEYVVFILATTDPNKLPETILSRCQKFNFKRIGIESIVGYLKKICSEEKIDIDEEALTFIAEKNGGSMRDSISMLDMVRAYSPNENLSKEKVVDILGIVDDDELKKITLAVNEGNVEDAINMLGESLEKGKDIGHFTNDLIWHIRNLLLVKDLSKPIDVLNITKTNFDKLKEEAKLISKNVLIYFIEELSKTYNVMKYDENRRVILETALIRLANPETNFLESAVMARLKNVEDLQKEGHFVKVVDKVQGKKESTTEQRDDKIKELKLSPATMEEIKKVTDNWKTISSSSDIRAKTILQRSKAIPMDEKGTGFVEVQVKDRDYDFLNGFNIIKQVEDNLSDVAKSVIGKDIKFKIISLKDSKHAENVHWSIDDAISKIDMKIEEQDD